ncbi:MAG: glycosyltransferase family 39 protein [Planctomycetes bacterium]|nr:glycosyltransferase family 39 protein [Planctomycetota bacterium]
MKRTRALLLVWLGAFAAFFCTAHGNLESLDSTFTMHAARALLHRGDSGLLGSGQAGASRSEQEIVALIADRAAHGVQAYGKVGRNGLTYVWFPMGHVWLMVPCVALGDALQAVFPSLEERFRTASRASPQSYRFSEFVTSHAAVAMLLPPLFGATSVLLLFLIAGALGAAPRDAAWSTAAIALATQLFPLGSETLSDGPGMCFLLAALYATVRAHCGTATVRTLLLGGLAAGAAVLTRYPHGLLVPPLLLAVALAGLRRGRRADALWFALGGLPCLLLLLTVDHLRFGSVSDTGYPAAGSWFNYPVYFGVLKLLIAAGKGILWFSPMLWLALPAATSRARVPELRWLAWLLFAIPMLMFGSTNGWQSGQCWGVRYVTPGVVALCALALPQALPWRSFRRTFLLLFAAGAFVNLTSVIAPTRGHNQLAGQAVRAMYDRELAAGQITEADRHGVDEADHYFFLPRFSPLHANWTYAFKSWRGDFEDASGAPRNGSANTIGPLFGIEAVPGAMPPQDLAPVQWEDRGGRHLWWVFWGTLLGVPALLLLLPALAVAVVATWLGWRGVLAMPAPVEIPDTR